MKKYEKEEIKSDDTKTINFDDVTKKNKKKNIIQLATNS